MNQEDRQAMMTEIEQLRHQNAVLKTKHHQSLLYIRDKVNQLLGVVGTIPLKPEELDDDTLIELDPIGIVSDAFTQILDHLRVTNDKLQETHDELQAIFDSASVGIVLVDAQYRILTYNSQAAKQLFQGQGDVIGQTCYDAICHHPCEPDSCLISRATSSGSRCSRKNLSLQNHQYDLVATPILDNNGNVSCVVTVFTDITERLRSEAALRESEERLRNLFENTTNLILIVSFDGQIQYVNQACCNALRYGQDELYALAIQDIIAPQEKYTARRQFRAILNGSGQDHISTVMQTKDGALVEVEGSASCQMADGKPVAFRAILRDVTIQRRLELEMSRTQKLESVGILAGGIAHDFNNLLAGILSNITLARFDLPADNKANGRLLETEKAVVRAQHLTQQLLTFSKGGMPVVQDVTIARLLHDSVRFSLSGSNVESVFSIPDNLWQVKADPGQIDQVIQNLVINSDQAMPDGGQIKVSCQNITISEDDPVPLAAGSYVCISIADQGQGIPRDIQQKIFDPYFTTKEQGIGLGLSTSHAIIHKHQGHITVQSDMGAGATFQVYLPAVCRQTQSPVDPLEETFISGSGRILVMDDEEMIRKTTAELLNFLGYNVDTAADGEETVTLYRQAMATGDPYQVVIMDLTVPGGMGGVETMAALHKLDPEVNGISTSGYCDDPVMANYADYGFKAVLPKPCKINLMAQTIQSLLTH
ncbi:MAG: PAS domain S-box protein [Deltaproteobacteria bacterium]|nr:PAS domain S-box protein [Candidatus Anaeroferrophillus wilburensis]MBN2888188.1 PAS domain S-box protein [Deltaproteobacteria bacterium]